MKLRISCFDKTVFRKDITRFAPLWAIYLIGGLLVMLTNLASQDSLYAARDLAQTIGPFGIINMIYAALCAQLLFGDLYNSRMCNALHAMPLRRETWFVTHLVSGLCFSIVPHFVGAALMLPLLGNVAVVSWIWLLGMILEFLFFFGLAVFSAFCAGNRLAMAAVYAILNFASVIAYWFVTTIYEPLLYGVTINDEIFALLSPVIQMAGKSDLVAFKYVYQESMYETRWAYEGMGEGWGYLTICAGIGVALMVLGLLLYRHRKLECAGDFIAEKAMEPIFAVVFTLCTGCVFAFVGEAFADYLLFLIVGLILGWFVGQMLLRRTIRVFQWKTFLKFGILALTLGATLLLSTLDPLGIIRWLPEQENVAKVEVYQGKNIYAGSTELLTVTEAEEIQKVLSAHQDLLEHRYNNGSGRNRTMSIRYTMNDGAKVSRTYTVYAKSEAWDIFKELFDTPERILGYTVWDRFVTSVDLSLDGVSLMRLCDKLAQQALKNGEVTQDEVALYSKELFYSLRLSLLEAMKKDCEEGNLSQNFTEGKTYKTSIEIQELTGVRVRYLTIYTSSANTVAWLEEYSEYLGLPEYIYSK